MEVSVKSTCWLTSLSLQPNGYFLILLEVSVKSRAEDQEPTHPFTDTSSMRAYNHIIDILRYNIHDKYIEQCFRLYVFTSHQSEIVVSALNVLRS